MSNSYIYGRSQCHVCGHMVADNWYIRHVKSGCAKGVTGVSIQIDGITFFDDSGADLKTRMRRAIERYEAKRSRKPTHCEVNSRLVSGSGQRMAGVLLVASNRVGPNELYIGE